MDRLRCLGAFLALAALAGFPSVWAAQPRKIMIRLPALKASTPVSLRAARAVPLALDLDPGWKVNPSAPSWFAIFNADSKALIREYTRDELKKNKALALPELQLGKNYRLQGTLYFCEEQDPDICVRQSHDQVIRAALSGQEELKIRFQSPK